MNFIKRFADWISLKTELDIIKTFPKFEEGQIWWCYLGENIGHEENGKGKDFLRPVIIIKKFNNRIFYGIPTSSKLKDNKYYYELTIKNRQVSALLSQMRLLDVNRLLYKQSRLSSNELTELKNAFVEIL